MPTDKLTLSDYIDEGYSDDHNRSILNNWIDNIDGQIRDQKEKENELKEKFFIELEKSRIAMDKIFHSRYQHVQLLLEFNSLNIKKKKKGKE